jgi:hypothetical protein
LISTLVENRHVELTVMAEFLENALQAVLIAEPIYLGSWI